MARRNTKYLGKTDIEEFYEADRQFLIDVFNGRYYNVKNKYEKLSVEYSVGFRSAYNTYYQSKQIVPYKTKYIEYKNIIAQVEQRGFDDYFVEYIENIDDNKEVYDEFQRRKKQGNAGTNRLQPTGRRHTRNMSVYENRRTGKKSVILYREQSKQRRIYNDERNRESNVEQKLNQDRNTDSSREILATALESTVKNDTERQLIKSYRDNIDKLWPG